VTVRPLSILLKQFFMFAEQDECTAKRDTIPPITQVWLGGARLLLRESHANRTSSCEAHPDLTSAADGR
jgi:hypothetical protein